MPRWTGQFILHLLTTLSVINSTFVLSAQPEDAEGIPASELPPLFDNSTATGVTYTGLQYNASYGSGQGITETL